MFRGYMDPGVQLKCAMCKNEFACGIGYFRCESQNCDYDLCVRCAVTGEAGPRAPHVESLSCVHGHDLELDEKSEERKLPEVGYFTCRACRKVIIRAFGIYSCTNKCEFALCLECG